MENQKVERLITYSLDQQIFIFNTNCEHKESHEISNLNLELWGVNVDFTSYEEKWTIHGILQNMGFYPKTENPCVMMRENLKTLFSEYIVISQDELYIVSKTTPEEILKMLQEKHKIHITPEFPYDPGGKRTCQIKKYLEKIYRN